MYTWGGAGSEIGGQGPSTLSITLEALRLAAHGLIDLAIPIGMLHACITVLEVRLNDLVSKLSIRYHGLENPVPGSTLLADSKPFGLAFQRAWLTFAAWCAVGTGVSLVVFVTIIASPMLRFGLFLAFAVAGIAFNLKFGGSGFLFDLDGVFVSNLGQASLPASEAASQEPEVSV
ncbi:hypothetical protein BDV93DRAFT_526576 [Ceratobasidium sp. AG-I]|nr:hypothetical protein BDV93DRAFT_526576 [Ceratobasidium sp. AG-I]